MSSARKSGKPKSKFEGSRKILLKRRPAIGLKIYSDDKHRGFVSSIIDDTPASRAGNIQPGDVIAAVNGALMADATHEEIIHALKSAGDRVELTLLRPTDRVEATIERGGGGLGVKVYSDSKFKGVKISAVTEGGAVARNGLLRVNDVIVGIDEHDVTDSTHEEIVELLKNSGQTLRLAVLRPMPFTAVLECSARPLGLQVYSDVDFQGVRVFAIIEGGAAQETDLQIDDCILSVDDKPTVTAKHEEVLELLKNGGDVVRLVVCRPDDPAFEAALRGESGGAASMKRKRSSLALTPRLKKAFGFSRKNSKEDIGAAGASTAAAAGSASTSPTKEAAAAGQPAGLADWAAAAESSPAPMTESPTKSATAAAGSGSGSAASSAPTSPVKAAIPTAGAPEPAPGSAPAEPPHPFPRGHVWNPDSYRKQLSWIAGLGADLVDELDDALVECEGMLNVLDIGCGDGTLTAQVQDAGCKVKGIDTNADMVKAACRHGLDCEVLDVNDIVYSEQFDVCFSNATLHWIKRDPRRTVSKIHDALKPNGTLVAQFGCLGSLGAVRTALYAVLGRRGIDAESVDPWFFPSPKAYKEILQDFGFEVLKADRVVTSQALPGDISDFVRAYCGDFLAAVKPSDVDRVLLEVKESLRVSAQDEEGVWRLEWCDMRIVAKKSAESTA